MWPFILSDRLLIVALVGRYPSNKLIRRKPLLQRKLQKSLPFFLLPCGNRNAFGISSRFQLLSPSEGQVAYALLTRLPLDFIRSKLLMSSRSTCMC